LIYAGLDVGSRTTKLVTYDSDIRESVIVQTGVNPLQLCRQLVGERQIDQMVVTGYGRHLVAPVLQGEVVSEIKSFAVGARHLYPEAHSIIDIGGQDSKVIILSENGEVRKFEMNDRCAAGTGKFLEIMANTLGVTVETMGDLALKAERKIRINSLCTVFAESEVVSLISRGEDAPSIAMALHEAIATRISTMAKRNGVGEKVVFAGGGSLNPCLVQLLEQKLNTRLIIPASPQTVGALGAAVMAGNSETMPAR